MALLLALGVWALSYAMQSYGGAQARLLIPTGSTEAQLRDSLVKTLGDDYGTKVYRIWSMSGGNAAGTHGLYVIEPGQRAYAVARMLKNGRQTPVEGKWTDARTMQQVAGAPVPRGIGQPSCLTLTSFTGTPPARSWSTACSTTLTNSGPPTARPKPRSWA